MIKFIKFLGCITAGFLCAYAGAADPGPTIANTVEYGAVTWQGATQTISDTDVKGSDNVTVIGDFCVYSNVLATPATDTEPSFKITASTGGAGFVLTDTGIASGAYTIPYTLSLTAGVVAPPISLTENVESSNIKLDAFPTDTCSQSLADNVELTVTMTAANIASVPAGTYGQTITISVAEPTVS